MFPRSRFSVSRWLALIVIGVPLSLGATAFLAYLGIGPRRTVVCDDLSDRSQWFWGDRLGHVDGASFTGCVVPTTLSLVLAVIAGVLTLSFCAFLAFTSSDDADRTHSM